VNVCNVERETYARAGQDQEGLEDSTQR